MSKISWRQVWHGYWLSVRSPEDMFAGMAAPPGWRQEVALRCFGRTVYFIFPANPGSDFRKNDYIL